MDGQCCLGCGRPATFEFKNLETGYRTSSAASTPRALTLETQRGFCRYEASTIEPCRRLTSQGSRSSSMRSPTPTAVRSCKVSAYMNASRDLWCPSGICRSPSNNVTTHDGGTKPGPLANTGSRYILTVPDQPDSCMHGRAILAFHDSSSSGYGPKISSTCGGTSPDMRLQARGANAS
jgi:hypothetical protein